MRPAFPELAATALLVIDMQEYFRGLAEPILAPLGKVIRALRRADVPVIYTQHGHRDPARDGGMLQIWWDDHILVDTPGWALLPEIAPRPGETVIAKQRYSAFHGTDLASLLHRRKITDLIISGVMTNLCCETTARDAFVRDFRVFFLTDGTATASAAMHRASLTNLGYGFATLLSCRRLAAAVSGAE